MKNLIFILFIALIYVEASEINSTIKLLDSNSSDKNDSQNFSTALLEKNLKFCSLIKNKDKKIECFGVLKRDTGYCDMIKDKDLKNKCLSVALSDKSLCGKINNQIVQDECLVLDR